MLAPERVCRDYFHDLLVLESQIPGGSGEEPHFLAVATYNLQHPREFMPAMLVGLRRTLADVLAGRATVADARHRARGATDGPTRVLRRVEMPFSAAELKLLSAWPTHWTMTIRDVCGVAPERYTAQVRVWANAVTADLDAVPIRAD
jgi:hypothetical protein